jgi:hypothetical protein
VRSLKDELERIEAECKDELMAAHKAGVKAPHPTADSIYNFFLLNIQGINMEMGYTMKVESQLSLLLH